MEEKYERKGRERINRTKGRPTQYRKPTHHRRRPATSKQKRGEKKEKESAAAEALLLARNMTTRTTLLLQRFGGSDWTIHFNCKIPATTSNHAKSSSSSVSGLKFATTGSRKASSGQLYGCRSVHLSPVVRQSGCYHQLCDIDAKSLTRVATCVKDVEERGKNKQHSLG